MVDSILGFLLAVFGAFQLQLGVAYTEQIIHRLLGMFTREQLQETISQEMSAGSRVLEKFLRILRLLAQQTGSSFKTLLPNIISFCLDQIHPLIAEVHFVVLSLFVLHVLLGFEFYLDRLHMKEAYKASTENSLELIELSSINKVSLA